MNCNAMPPRKVGGGRHRWVAVSEPDPGGLEAFELQAAAVEVPHGSVDRVGGSQIFGGVDFADGLAVLAKGLNSCSSPALPAAVRLNSSPSMLFSEGSVRLVNEVVVPSVRRTTTGRWW